MLVNSGEKDKPSFCTGYNYNGANYLEYTIPLPTGEIENR